MTYASLGIGSARVPLNPIIGSKLYWQATVPKLTYGFEILQTKKCVNLLEDSHCDAARILQGLPPQTAGVGCLATLGWGSMEAYVDVLKLMFMWRILLLPMNCIYKVIMLIRIHYHLNDQGGSHSGPTWEMVKICKKYNLIRYVMDGLNFGLYMSLMEWKREVKNCVSEYDKQCIGVTSTLFSSLRQINFELHFVNSWWIHALRNPHLSSKVRFLIKLLLGLNNLNTCLYKYKKSSTNKCRLCNGHSQETIAHILFECTVTKNSRDTQWNEIKNEGLMNCISDLDRMDIDSRCHFILNGFNSNYVEEWNLTYTLLLQYIYNVYMYHSQIVSLPE
jgi:hypothetical protein